MLFPNFVDLLIKKNFLESNCDLAQIDRNLEKYLKVHLDAFMSAVSPHEEPKREDRLAISREVYEKSEQRARASAQSKSHANDSHKNSRLELSVKSKKSKHLMNSQNNFLDTEAKPKLEEIVAKKSKREYQFTQTEDDFIQSSETQRDRALLVGFKETLFTKELFSLDSLGVYLKDHPFDFEFSTLFFFDLDKYQNRRRKKVKTRPIYSLANCQVDSFSEFGSSGSSEDYAAKEIKRKRGFSHKMFNVAYNHRKKRFSIEEEESATITNYFNREIKHKKSMKNRNLLFDLKMNFRRLETKYNNDIGKFDEKSTSSHSTRTTRSGTTTKRRLRKSSSKSWSNSGFCSTRRTWSTSWTWPRSGRTRMLTKFHKNSRECIS